MVEAYQVRAARGLLDWSQSKLAKRAKVGLSTVRNFESGRSDIRISNLRAIAAALEKAGVEFIPGGVQLRSASRRAQADVVPTKRRTSR